MKLSLEQAEEVLRELNYLDGRPFTMPDQKVWHPFIVKAPIEPEHLQNYLLRVVDLLPDVDAAHQYTYRSPSETYSIYVILPDHLEVGFRFFCTLEEWMSMTNLAFDLNRYR